jgi:hypothetical protein
MVYPYVLYLNILGCGIRVLVELFSPAIMSHHTNLPSFVMLSWFVIYCASCCLPSFVM